MPGTSAFPTRHQFISCGADDLQTPSGAASQYGYTPGGYVDEYTAAAQLKIGDIVYLSGANAVNKTNTLATTAGKVVGVVCGGAQTYMQCIDRKLDVGQIAANANERVLVLSWGKYWVVADSAIAVGDTLVQGAVTAGRAATAAALAIAAGATPVTSAAANGTTDITGNPISAVVGMALEAAGGAATTILARIKAGA